jgi:hypothetical protein
LNVPTLVRFVRQSGYHGDCGVATLGMLGGCLYEDALAAVVRYQPAALHAGLTWPQMRRAAKRLGLSTRLLRRYDIDEATGILNVVDKKGDEHFVFLWEGRIVEVNVELWLSAQEYLGSYGYTAKSLLVALEVK